MVNRSALIVAMAVLMGATENLFAVSQTWELQKEMSNDVIFQDAPEGIVSVLTDGADPFVVFTPREQFVAPEGATVLAFEYFCPDSINNLKVFFADGAAKRPNWSPQKVVEGGSMPKAEGWQPFSVQLLPSGEGNWQRQQTAFRLDFGNIPGVQIQIRNLELRPPTEEELRGAEEALAIREERKRIGEKIDAALARDTSRAKIESVTVTENSVILKGKTEVDAEVIEWEPHENDWEEHSGRPTEQEIAPGEFTITLERFVGGRDRLANRFALLEKSSDVNAWSLLTSARWADDVSGAAEREMPRLRPANRKGMAGIAKDYFPVWEDIKELGVTAATINLLISSQLFAPDERYGYPFEHQGRTWFFNRGLVGVWDLVIKRLTDEEIVVTAIILLTKDNELLAHPAASPAGIYSMVNLTNQESADAYRAVMAFLAERYSRPDKEFGWVTHWILFNEVDFGWVWTNMGEQPLSVYMDHFHRALRLAWLETRRFNPTSEVFLSLTHHWDYETADPLRTYAPRAILDRLAEYTQLGGDFAWGLAHHPYPQSLLNARTWEDTEATFEFDTHKITPKNIEVLVAYLNQEHFLHNGKQRTLLLSEQGFHTPDYSEESMRDKAAGIAFMWEKMKPLNIESFHYHRWIDHPLEGGLKVGLRTLPDDENPHGVRKELPFRTLAAMETDRQEEAAAPFKEVIGVTDWDEIRKDPAEITP